MIVIATDRAASLNDFNAESNAGRQRANSGRFTTGSSEVFNAITRIVKCTTSRRISSRSVINATGFCFSFPPRITNVRSSAARNSPSNAVSDLPLLVSPLTGRIAATKSDAATHVSATA